MRYLGTSHTAVHCTRADIGAAFPRAIWHTETPIVRTAPTPLMLLSGAVRAEGYKVVLTGEGADEVFGGYDLFKEAKIRRFWARAPQSKLRPRMLRTALSLSASIRPRRAGRSRSSFFGQGMRAPATAVLRAHSALDDDAPYLAVLLRRACASALDGLGSRTPALPRLAARRASTAGRRLSRDQYVEAHTLLSGYLLCSQGDRMAMANSIEGRFPFLDHRVIEFANRLPPQPQAAVG